MLLQQWQILASLLSAKSAALKTRRDQLTNVEAIQRLGVTYLHQPDKDSSGGADGIYQFYLG